MPIRIVAHGQTYQKDIKGAVFTLKRESLKRRQELQSLYLHEPGRPPRLLLLGLARLEEALVDWTGVLGGDGQPIPFDRALIQSLPDSVRDELLGALNEGPDPLAEPSRTISPPLSGSPNGEKPTEA